MHDVNTMYVSHLLQAYLIYIVMLEDMFLFIDTNISTCGRLVSTTPRWIGVFKVCMHTSRTCRVWRPQMLMIKPQAQNVGFE